MRVSPHQVSNLLERPLILELITVNLSKLLRVVINLPISLAALIAQPRANKQLPARS